MLILCLRWAERGPACPLARLSSGCPVIRRQLGCMAASWGLSAALPCSVLPHEMATLHILRVTRPCVQI